MWPSVSAAILLSQSVAVDCCSSIVGLGVCDLNVYLTQRGLIHKNNRPCLVVCTHCHFDHAGGAHHFTSDQVYVHAADADEVQTGRQVATLNYVKPAHFMQQPYPGFTASHYRVPPTACQLMNTGQVCTVLLSTDDHSSGSIVQYYCQYSLHGCVTFICMKRFSCVKGLQTCNIITIIITTTTTNNNNIIII